MVTLTTAHPHLKISKLPLNPLNIIHGKRESPSKPSFAPRPQPAPLFTPEIVSPQEIIDQPAEIRRQKLKSHSFSGIAVPIQVKREHRAARVFDAGDHPAVENLKIQGNFDSPPRRPSPTNNSNTPDSAIQIDIDSLYNARHGVWSPDHVSVASKSSVSSLQADYFTSRVCDTSRLTPDRQTPQQIPSTPDEIVARMPDWADGTVGVTGLKNLGNTCFLNAAIQCLSATVPLARFLRDGSYRLFLNRQAKFGSHGTRALARLFTVIWSAEHSRVVPLAVRDAVWKYGGPQFQGFEQQDSQEVLTFLLDALHEDLNLVKVKGKNDLSEAQEEALEHMSSEKAARKEWDRALLRDNSVIVNWFYGQERSRLTCQTCHGTSTTWTSFGILPLQLSACPDRTSITIEDLIRAYCVTETLPKEDEWRCGCCKMPRAAKKTLTITRLPPILILHLSRSTYNDYGLADKDDRPVAYPLENLDLSNFIGHKQKAIYDLYASVNHLGSADFGHYTALVRSRNTWIECNDGQTRKVSTDEFPNCLYSMLSSALVNGLM